MILVNFDDLDSCNSVHKNTRTLHLAPHIEIMHVESMVHIEILYKVTYADGATSAVVGV